MSGLIRKLIGPRKMRLQYYIEEASSLLLSRVEEKTLEDDKIRVEEVIASINTNVSLLEHYNCDWLSLLKDLKNEDQSKEEKEYQRVAEGSKGYIEILMDMNEMVGHLQSWLKLIARTRAQIKTLTTSKEAGAIVNTNVNFTSGGYNIEAANLGMGVLRVTFPKLQLMVIFNNGRNFGTILILPFMNNRRCQQYQSLII